MSHDDPRPCIHCGSPQDEHAGNQSVYCVEGTVFYEPQVASLGETTRVHGGPLTEAEISRLIDREARLESEKLREIADDLARVERQIAMTTVSRDRDEFALRQKVDDLTARLARAEQERDQLREFVDHLATCPSCRMNAATSPIGQLKTLCDKARRIRPSTTGEPNNGN